MTLSRSAIFFVVFTNRIKRSWGISLAKFGPIALDFEHKIMLATFFESSCTIKRQRHTHIRRQLQLTWGILTVKTRSRNFSLTNNRRTLGGEKYRILFWNSSETSSYLLNTWLVFRTNQRKLRGLDWFCWLICSEEKILSNRFYSFFVTFNRKIAMKPEDICYGSWLTQFWTSLAASDFL